MPKADPAPATSVAVAVNGQAVPADVPTPELPGLSDETDWLATGFYGEGGAGKSTDLAAMAKLIPQDSEAKVLLINAESGMKPSALRRLGIPAGPDRIRVWPDQSRGETITFDSFERLYFRVKADLMRDPGCWFGVGLDSITEVIRLLVVDERTRQYNRAQRRGKERERYFTDRDDYQAVTAMIGERLREFRHLPCHFAFSALQRRDDDGFYGPAANPAVANDLPGFVDLLIHCEIQEIADDDADVFTGWTKKHGKYRAKDRYGWLPKALPDPTFDRLFQWVRGELDEQTDTALAAVKRRRAAVAGEVAQTG